VALNAQFTYHHAFSLGRGAIDPDVAVDPSGNVYVVGTFEGVFDIDPGPGVHTIIQSGGVGSDLFVAKYNDSGVLLWAFPLGNFGYDRADGIEVNDSQVCIIGTANSPLGFDLDPGPGDTHIYPGYVDVFLARYDLDGNFISGFSVGGIEVDYGTDIELYPNGDVVLSGYYRSSDFDADPGSGIVLLPPLVQITDAFILKYNAGNELLLAKGFGGDSGDQLKALHHAANGDLLVIGHFASTEVDVDAGPDTVLLGTAGGYDILVQRYSPDGTMLWARSIGGTGSDIGYGVATDSNGDVYLCGYTSSDTVDLDPGPGVEVFTGNGPDIVVVKLSADGDYIWGMRIGGGANDSGNAIAIDSQDHLFVAGAFGDVNVDFDPGPGTAELSSSSAAETDLFIAQFNPDGTFVDAFDVGGAGMDAISNMACTTSGRLWVTGRKTGAIDADPGSGVAMLDSIATIDLLVAAYDHYHPVAIEETEQPQLTLQPNPARDYVVLNAPLTGPARAELRDAKGRLLHAETVNAFPAQLDLHGLPSGIHVVTVKGRSGNFSRTLLKVR